jgi:hypothetical protein
MAKKMGVGVFAAFSVVVLREGEGRGSHDLHAERRDQGTGTECDKDRDVPRRETHVQADE